MVSWNDPPTSSERTPRFLISSRHVLQAILYSNDRILDILRIRRIASSNFRNDSTVASSGSKFTLADMYVPNIRLHRANVAFQCLSIRDWSAVRSPACVASASSVSSAAELNEVTTRLKRSLASSLSLLDARSKRVISDVA